MAASPTSTTATLASKITPRMRSSSGPSVNGAAGARRSAEARQVLREGRALARAQRDRDAELLEVLRERLAAEVDLARADERVDVPLELGRGERDDALGQAPERLLGVPALHRVPVGLDELACELAGLDAREERADDERRVLRPDLAVERARERLPDERGLAEAGEGVEVALLLLGGRGGAKAAEKLVVACPVARVRQDRDERGEDVRVHVIAARDVGRVALGGLALDCGIVAEGAEGAREVASELTRQLVLAWARGPPERDEGRRHAIADERRQARAVGGLDDPVERVEGREQNRPDVPVALAPEARGQVEIVGEAPEAGDGDRPGVVHEIEALDRREVVQLADEALEQLRRVPHAVEAVPALVDDDRVEPLRRRQAGLSLREHEARDGRRAASVEPELDRHAPALAGLAGGLRALGRLREVGEALLAQDELTSLDPRADERVARREDPAIHHVGDRLARCLAEPP